MENKEIHSELLNIIANCKDINQNELTQKVETLLASEPEFQSLFIRRFHVSGFYRARVHDSLFGVNDNWHFKSEQEFWNREAESITSIGRCNDVKQSYLYCSTDFNTAVLESRPKKRKFISVSRFNLINDENYNGARTAIIGAKYLSEMQVLKNLIKLKNFQGDSEFSKIDKTLDELFHQNVSKKEHHLYKMSIAVTSCMMRNLICDDEIQYPMHAMLYPSIQRNKQHFNIIFKPIHARIHYELTEVMTFFINEEDDDKFQLVSKRVGTTVKSEKFDPLDFYKIEWKNVIKEEICDVTKV